MSAYPYQDPALSQPDATQHPQQQQQPNMSYATQNYPYVQQAPSSSSSAAHHYYASSGYPLGGHDARNSVQYTNQMNATPAYGYAQQSAYPLPTPFTVPSNAPASSSSHAYAAATPHSPSSMHYTSSPSSPSFASQPAAERFICPHCNKSFTRNFDRKRHMEIHSPGSSGNNRCLYCRKEYSRADSLKRHIDNGCEMKPS